MPEFLETQSGRRLAYERIPGTGPGVVFLGGFMSDMEGTKALHLAEWARSTGRAFLRFDYSGHGQSSGAFTDGCIGDWAQDAEDAIGELTEGPQVLVGSSMGGWISLILAGKIPEKLAGIVGIASAPDFTEDSMWAGFSENQRSELRSKGMIDLPSDYDDPYKITMRLIEDGRDNLVLRKPLKLPFPARFLQGTDDADVEQSVALRILEHAQGHDIQLCMVKGADHRFSTDTCLQMIVDATQDVINRSAITHA